MEQVIIRSVMAVLLIILAMLFVLTSVAFVLVAAYRVAEPVWGPSGAAGAVAGLSFFLALLLIGAAALIGRGGKRSGGSVSAGDGSPGRPPGRSGRDAGGLDSAATDAMLRSWVRRSPWEAMATAVIGGVVYVRVPEARRMVMRLLSDPHPGDEPDRRNTTDRPPL